MIEEGGCIPSRVVRGDIICLLESWYRLILVSVVPVDKLRDHGFYPSVCAFVGDAIESASSVFHVEVVLLDFKEPSGRPPGRALQPLQPLQRLMVGDDRESIPF